MATPKNPTTSQKNSLAGGSGVPGEGGGRRLAPRSIATDRVGLMGGSKQGQIGKDALFSFDQQNLDKFSLPTGGAVGGGARGLRGLAGSRKVRPPKPLTSSSTESAAPKGTEGATVAGNGAVAASLSKVFSTPPAVRAAVPEVAGNDDNSNDDAGKSLVGECSYDDGTPVSITCVSERHRLSSRLFFLEPKPKH